MKHLIAKMKWILNGKPTITLPGFHCGCCGKYIEKPFKIRNYNSKENIIVETDEDYQKYWYYTWGMCDTCAKGDFE